jgi:large subunit ribosomal protein L6
MSRLGKTPIPLPQGVEVKSEGQHVSVKGKKGTLTCALVDGLLIKVEGEQLLVMVQPDFDLPSAMHGLYRALLNNMVVGVSKGFEKRLSLVGVGYRAQVQGTSLDLQLGFSHPVKLPIPPAVQVAVDKSVSILVTGVSKQAVGHFAAVIRAQRPPEPYKGKGIRYENEVVRKKAGKAAKGKGAG